jgi:hypothetical protein
METNSNLTSRDISIKLQEGFEKVRKKLIEKEKKPTVTSSLLIKKEISKKLLLKIFEGELDSKAK